MFRKHCVYYLMLVPDIQIKWPCCVWGRFMTGIDLSLPSMDLCHPWHKELCLVWMKKKMLVPNLVTKLSSRCNDKNSCLCTFFLFYWHLTTWPFPFLHGSLFSQFRASSLLEYFYLQGCVFSVFALLCLIDSNMGFLNGLSSDLFPQELMTQNDFKDAWWECRSLWSETTGFVVIYPTDLNQNFKDS